MPFGRRMQIKARTPRSVGFDVGLGLAEPVEVELDLTDQHHDPQQCAHCGEIGQVYMVDAPRIRAYLVCPSCKNEWEADRFRVTLGRRTA